MSRFARHPDDCPGTVHARRVVSPSGGSTFTTSAPWSPSSFPAYAAEKPLPSSSTRGGSVIGDYPPLREQSTRMEQSPPGASATGGACSMVVERGRATGGPEARLWGTSMEQTCPGSASDPVRLFHGRRAGPGHRRAGGTAVGHFHGTNVSGERQRPGAIVPWSSSGAGPQAKPKAAAVGHSHQCR